MVRSFKVSCSPPCPKTLNKILMPLLKTLSTYIVLNTHKWAFSLWAIGAIRTNQACARYLLKGFQTASYPTDIPLLQYANNTTFSMEGSVEEAKNLSMLLDIFANVSGLQINRAKSVFVGFGLSSEEAQCWEALGTPIRSLRMRYPGLPLTRGRLFKADWQSVIEEMEKRVDGWQNRVMGPVSGRVILFLFLHSYLRSCHYFLTVVLLK